MPTFCPHCQEEVGADDLVEADELDVQEKEPVWCKDCQAETLAWGGTQCDECGNGDVHPL